MLSHLTPAIVNFCDCSEVLSHHSSAIVNFCNSSEVLRGLFFTRMAHTTTKQHLRQRVQKLEEQVRFLMSEMKRIKQKYEDDDSPEKDVEIEIYEEQGDNFKLSEKENKDQELWTKLEDDRNKEHSLRLKFQEELREEKEVQLRLKQERDSEQELRLKLEVELIKERELRLKLERDWNIGQERCLRLEEELREEREALAKLKSELYMQQEQQRDAERRCAEQCEDKHLHKETWHVLHVTSVYKALAEVRGLPLVQLLKCIGATYPVEQNVRSGIQCCHYFRAYYEEAQREAFHLADPNDHQGKCDMDYS
ncbi:hypothetical protein ANN_00247 [Periplaneta americana]|uniref:Uncharacterized protein n=1 Tax=Periplaneta americana TaxID=6978 RepID=A0ABQ8TQ89_PERAM|nr:hypothetical protein ANN_00247 [Periplaneta americana]